MNFKLLQSGPNSKNYLITIYTQKTGTTQCTYDFQETSRKLVFQHSSSKTYKYINRKNFFIKTKNINCEYIFLTEIHFRTVSKGTSLGSSKDLERDNYKDVHLFIIKNHPLLWTEWWPSHLIRSNYQNLHYPKR